MLIRVLLDDAKGVLVGVERCHENQRNIDAVGGVEMLDLSDSKIEECHVILDLESTLGTSHTWADVGDLEPWKDMDIPMDVPRPPLTLRTASLLRFFASPAGRSEYGTIWSSAGDLIRSQSLEEREGQILGKQRTRIYAHRGTLLARSAK